VIFLAKKQNLNAITGKFDLTLSATNPGIDFINLDGTPSTYTGSSGKSAIVNSAEDALVFKFPLKLENAAGNSSVILTDTESSNTLTVALDGSTVGTVSTSLWTFNTPLAMSTNKITGLDTPTATTDAATKAYVDSLASGLSWLDAVISFTTQAAATETTGNRYIASADGASWTENNIYEWSGSAWTETVAVDKFAVKVTSEGKFYTYNASIGAWQDLGASFSHNTLLDLQGGTSNEYYHLTNAEHTNVFIKNVDDTDDLIEGSTNLFYTDGKVDIRVQGASSDYTIQGDWIFNNNITQASVPTLSSHLTNKTYVDSLVQGLSWQDPVIDKDLSTPPVSPSIDDRYIVAGTASNWYNASWDYRQKVTIDNTKVAGNETDFPVLVLIDANANGVFTKAQSSGNDILFTSSDGTTKIPHEIERFDIADGSRILVAWVKSNLSGSSDTEVYMYYGNSSSGDQQQVTSVWDSNYSMVQHMKSSTGSFFDSTSNDNDGTASASVTENQDGKVGYDAVFNGSNGYVTLPSSNAITGDSLANCTFEAWVKFSSTGSSYIASIKRSAAQSTLFSLTANYSSTGTLGALIRNDPNTSHIATVYAGSYNDNAWHHLVVTVEGATRIVYVDGSQVATDSNGMASVTGNTATASIGSFSGTSISYTGSIDDTRFSQTNRSANWISTQYANQNSPSTFFSIGSEETPSASGDWAGHINDITQYDGVNWVFFTPSDGWTVIVTDESEQYTWNVSAWVSGGASDVHNSLSGLQGGTTDEYYHLTSSEYTELNQWLDSVALSTDGSMDIGVGDFDTTGDITCEDITAAGIVQTEMVLANGSGSHPSGIGAYLELYVLSGTTCRILPYNGSSYYDLAIGDWNGGDPNIMLKTGGAVGINEGSPESKLHVNGDFLARKTSGNQIEAQYNASNKLAISVDGSGDASVTATGGNIDFVNENLSTTGTVFAGYDSKFYSADSSVEVKEYTVGGVAAGFTAKAGVIMGSPQGPLSSAFGVADSIVLLDIGGNDETSILFAKQDLSNTCSINADFTEGYLYSDINFGIIEDADPTFFLKDDTEGTAVSFEFDGVNKILHVDKELYLSVEETKDSVLYLTGEDYIGTDSPVDSIEFTRIFKNNVTADTLFHTAFYLNPIYETGYTGSPANTHLMLYSFENFVERQGTINGYGASCDEEVFGILGTTKNVATYSGSEDYTVDSFGVKGFVNDQVELNSAGKTLTLTDVGLHSTVTSTVNETAGTLNLNIIGLHVEDLDASGVSISNGTVNAYGIKIDSVTSPGNNWGIHDSSGQDWYLNGKIKFGSALKYIYNDATDLTLVSDAAINLKPTATEYMTVDNVTVGALGDFPVISFTSTNFAAGTYFGGVYDSLIVLENNRLGQLMFVNSDASDTVSLIHDDTNTRFYTDCDFQIGDGDTGTDFSLFFEGENSTGQITWMEALDYFQFQDDILMVTTEKIQFRDTAISISSIDDGHLDLTADISIDLNSPQTFFNGDTLYQQTDSDIEEKHEATYTTPADGNVLASYKFFGNDDLDASYEFARMEAVIETVDNTESCGEFRFYGRGDSEFGTIPLRIGSSTAGGWVGAVDDTHFASGDEVEPLGIWSEWEIAKTGSTAIDADNAKLIAFESIVELQTENGNISTPIAGNEFISEIVAEATGSGDISSNLIGLKFGMDIDLSSATGSVTGGYTALQVRVNETAIGSGTNYLLDLEVDGTSKFTIDNSGNVSIVNNAKLYFRDTSLYVTSDTDGELDLWADSKIILNTTATESLEYSSYNVPTIGIDIPTLTPVSTGALGNAMGIVGGLLIKDTRTTSTGLDFGGGVFADGTLWNVTSNQQNPALTTGQTLFAFGQFMNVTREGTIDAYGANAGEFNIAHYFAIGNEATYSGSEDYSIINDGINGSVNNEATFNAAGKTFTIANFGITTSVDSEETLTAGTLTVSNTGITAQISTTASDVDADIVNKIYNVGNINSSSTHNASIYDSQGYGWYNVSDNAPMRFGSGNSSSGIENEGDVEITYTGVDWDFDIRIATTAIRFNPSLFDTNFEVYSDTGIGLFVQGSDGNVGIGTASPELKIHIGPDAPTGTYLDSTNNNGLLVAPGVARGMLSAEGDSEAWLTLLAQDGTANKRMAGIEVDGSEWFFRSLNDGLGLRQTFMQGNMATTTGDLLLQPAGGNVGIGTASPVAQLHIDQSGTTAAIPTLILDQADVSEGTINFVASERAAITGATNSLKSVRVELNGTVYRLALYVDA